MRGGAQVRREGKPRAEDAAGMAALLEDLRPVLDAYRNHGEEQVDAELSALDVCMEEAFYCLEYGWRAESFDAVLIDDPDFRRFRGRVTKDEAEYLRGMIRHVQRKADLLVGELCALEKFAGRDLYGCTVAELRELVDREVRAGEAERLEGVSGNMRRAAERRRVATLRSVAAAAVLGLWDQYREGVVKPRYSAFIDRHGGDVTGNWSGVTVKAALRSMARDGEAEADALKRLCNGRAQNRRRGKA